MNKIPIGDRLIFALDTATADQARTLVKSLADTINFYKLGLELLASGDYFVLAEELLEQGKKVFLDLKLFDVPRTVATAVKGLHRFGDSFVTIHGNDAMLKAANDEKGDLKILAVTALTSLDQRDIDTLGFKCDVQQLVLARAQCALAVGCDGVVASGLEASSIKQTMGSKMLIVTPGIRPIVNTDDQKRTVDLKSAFNNGADYIVVGRPIREASSPPDAAAQMQAQISKIFNT
ncbi:MAG: orotidine-5'-phosphate decarboxylase [Chromatiales bacterium]|nr:orotidine-5'-phosphate decarboxylase [Chromatiales bacterium]